MEQAFDRFLNRMVSAADCGRADYFRDRYICPSCEEHLVYAAGVVQQPHFKHGQGGSDCELRVAGMTQGPLGEIESERRDADILALFSVKKGLRHCSFVLRVRPPTALESIEVVIGKHSKTYLLHSRTQIDIPITDIAEHFVVTGFVSGFALNREIVKAFGPKPLIFRDGSNTSIRLPSSRLLRPGKYVACIPKEQVIQFPILCKAAEIKCDLDIRAITFEIPPSFNHRVVSFCRDSLGMQVQHRNFGYAVVDPLMLVELAPDCWASNKEGEIHLVLSSEIDSKLLSPIIVQYRDRFRLVSEKSEIEFSEHPKTIRLKFGKERQLIRIGLGDPIEFIAEFRFLETIPAPEFALFRFTFFKPDNGEVFHLCRSSWKLAEVLDEVRRGTCELQAVEYPRCLNLSTWNNGTRIFIEEKTIAATLTDILRRSKGPIKIEAGGYPPIVVRGDSKTPGVTRNSAQRKKFQSGRASARRLRQTHAMNLGFCSRYSANIHD